MTCATCGKENEWKSCEKCEGTGAVNVPGSRWQAKLCPDCRGEGGKWVCGCPVKAGA